MKGFDESTENSHNHIEQGTKEENFSPQKEIKVFLQKSSAVTFCRRCRSLFYLIEQEANASKFRLPC